MDSGERSPSPFHIPEEILEEILANLPVKSLLRFRCASNSWRSLIDSREFINKHYKLSRRKVTLSNCNDPWHPPSTHSLTMEGERYFLCYCNGLLCMRIQNSFWLWNPATGISIQIPKLNDLQPIAYGIGWDEQSGAYKVFMGQYTIGEVYSLKTNSWKKVECPLSICCSSAGVFACGKIHWISRCGYYIESFDLKSDVFGKTELPSGPEGGVGRWLLREREGCLSPIYRDKETRDEDVWVMEEYGVKESWVKKSSMVPIVKTSLFYQKFIYVESLISPIYDEEEEEEE